ncbi:unnamed protein product [Echinostoma caproni]|uniref:N-terminal methionine N(alpha)-acetyltransferase NatE n=1 Tax=Echinostoma caproni TaxID=27848 RepID=A0A183BET0_9TREM|nr:unnamed protein product [Echinostoma caproni]
MCAQSPFVSENGQASHSITYFPDQLTIKPCGLRQIGQVRFILTTVFPELVCLKPSQWLSIITTSRVALYDQIVLGVICYRLETDERRAKNPDQDGEPFVYRCYITQLACLAPYRRLGIGTRLLSDIIEICEQRGDTAAIYLHTNVSNRAAIQCYSKLGFTVVATHKDYYRYEDGLLMVKHLQ